MSDYIPTIGLETHVQLNTNTKMFCGCPAEYGETPNSLVCPVCLGLPGALPSLNERAIELTILTGMMLGCKTPEVTKWDRKNYFYPDMPKNYQLTQFDLPLCDGGGVPLYDYAYPKDAQKNIVALGKVVVLDRIHLEEDVAKSTHHEGHTTIDFNRAGTPLMEIVTQPDIDSAEEAVAYINSLRQILIYGGVSDADMEKGQMRCDVNISVRPEGTEELGAKVELKNLNSISAIRRAIIFEIERQTRELKEGTAQIQSTRRWDDDLGETKLMRSKENAHDYRYFPEPDLRQVKTAAMFERAKVRVPELPHDKEARFVKEYDITEYDASVLASDQALATYFETAVGEGNTGAPPKKIANWVINTVLGQLNESSLEIAECPVEAPKLAALVALVEAGQVSNTQAKEIFSALFEAPEKNPADLAKELGFEPADEGEIDAIADQIIADNTGPADEVRGGNMKAIGFLVGQVMKASGGKANPKAVSDLLRSKLGV